jgi:YNFM family putative membrane transporter
MTCKAAAGTPAFQRIRRAMLFGGFSTFALLYCVQPLMPLLGAQFALSPAQASWVLSVSTLSLALSLVASSVLSDRIGRKALMVSAVSAAAVLTVLCALAQDYLQLLVLRALLGAALGGMPAVAMAYLVEEIEAPALGLAMGMYIGGTALGGMAGRVLAALVSDRYSWRLALAGMGAAGLYAAWEFWRSLPPSQHFRRGQSGWAALAGAMRGHLDDAGMPWLFGLGFLVMGAFVCLNNYISYRLLASPFSLGYSAVGALSVLYLIGMASAVQAGRLADRIGRRNVLWIVLLVMIAGLLLTLAQSLALVVAGMALFTFGFFGTHSVASSWVGLRARGAQALASALYLFFYYLGSSLVGSMAGLGWRGGGWPAVVAVLAAVLGGALLIALRLRCLAPLPPAPLAAAA